MNDTPPVFHNRDLHDAMYAVAQQRANDSSPPCAYCGAHTTVDLIETTAFNGVYQWVPSWDGRCSAACWKGDPAGYVAAATRTRNTVVA